MTDSSSILVVEDNDDDFEACEIALTEEREDAVPIYRCETGQEALDYLRRPHGRTRKCQPSVILLDLNLPGLGGYDVLRSIKGDPALCLIPVVVLTTSSDPADVEECYRSGANSYVTKPVDVPSFLHVVGRLGDYWLNTVELPR